jgi:DNA-binding beta-propeller fold protein YncE
MGAVGVGCAWLLPSACSESGDTAVTPAAAATTGGGGQPGSGGAQAAGGAGGSGGSAAARLPLTLIADVDLPGNATRFDYQDIDPEQGHLVIAHMSDASVVVVNLSDGALVKLLPNIPTARGVIVADDVGRIFVTSSPNQLVLIDNVSLTEIDRVETGNGPDGVGWDPADRIVAVSDQGDGAMSLIRDAGGGTRTQVPLGVETGNVVFDALRGRFWITVVRATPPDQLVAVDPIAASVEASIDLPGCSGAHGLRLHPDGQSAFIACEGNSVLAFVDLPSTQAVVTVPTGSGPDVMSIDPGLGWLYVAAESGELTVFDIRQPAVVMIDEENPGDNAHSVAVDAATHHVFFPLKAGPHGTPVLRIMTPSGVN